MAYIDERWPTRIVVQGHAVPMFDTEIVRTDGGHEQRNSRWSYPLLRFEFDMPPGRYSDADFLAVESLWYAARGPLHTFRFHYWRDTAAVDEPFGEGDGATTEFQLSRSYSAGSQTLVRQITKPLSGVVIKADGVTVGTADVDLETGVVTFASPPADGAVLTWSGDNDVEVRFDNDELNFIAYGQHGAAESVVLVEVKG